MLLLPSSKCVGTLSLLLADGFFNIAPLASTVERVAGTPFQYRSECEARDYFTLIALLYPDCVVEEALPRTLLALRRAESAQASASLEGSGRVSPAAAVRTQSSSASVQASIREGSGRPQSHLGEATTARADGAATRGAGSTGQLLLLQNPHEGFAANLSTDLPTLLASVKSPSKSAVSELPVDTAQFENTSASAALTGSVLPEVDAVPLTMDDLIALLTCRRSLATVLLSSLNELLHDVQYRELERSRPASHGGATSRQSEGAALQVTSELLLTAKLMLMTFMTASEIWLRRARDGGQSANASSTPSLTRTSASSTPPQALRRIGSAYRVVHHLLNSDAATTAAHFTSVPVEQWTWGRHKDALASWYDRTLDCLLQSAEAEGIQHDAFMQEAKTFAVQQGRAASRAPTLVLHRPCDGRPAVELNLSFMTTLNAAIAVPKMPLQLGEVQLLLYPRVAVPAAGVRRAVSCGHELLFDDSPASPTVDFLQRCTTHVCPSTMLQESGSEVPSLFRQRYGELASGARRSVRILLTDVTVLAAMMEKNAPMLARITLWCDGEWPPMRKAAQGDASAASYSHAAAAVTLLEGEDADEMPLSSFIKEAVMFRSSFSGAVGRYVREMVVLNGFDQVTLERWVRHICDNLAADGVLAPHRTTLAALVKFATLHRRWTLTSEVAELQKHHLA
uniref:Uncharacterized protein n=1 Tax=Angomonas deanei TaxID=59799 RepID=C6K3N9_9TRYP|nr:hypothetical protein CDFL6B12_01 [Angomonas deanei]